MDEIIHELKLSKKTVVEWTYFFRECCLTIMLENSEKIGGNGVEVEIDESKFGKHKYYRGHRVEGQWVFGGLKNTTNEKYSWYQLKIGSKKLLFLLYNNGFILDLSSTVIVGSLTTNIIKDWVHPCNCKS